MPVICDELKMFSTTINVAPQFDKAHWIKLYSVMGPLVLWPAELYGL